MRVLALGPQWSNFTEIGAKWMKNQENPTWSFGTAPGRARMGSRGCGICSGVLKGGSA